jgi:hypothetical protein
MPERYLTASTPYGRATHRTKDQILDFRSQV